MRPFLQLAPVGVLMRPDENIVHFLFFISYQSSDRMPPISRSIRALWIINGTNIKKKDPHVPFRAEIVCVCMDAGVWCVFVCMFVRLRPGLPALLIGGLRRSILLSCVSSPTVQGITVSPPIFSPFKVVV